MSDSANPSEKPDPGVEWDVEEEDLEAAAKAVGRAGRFALGCRVNS